MAKRNSASLLGRDKRSESTVYLVFAAVWRKLANSNDKSVQTASFVDLPFANATLRDNTANPDFIKSD